LPKFERLARWQAGHRQLLGNDAQYRKRHTSFLIAIVCLSIPLVAVYSFYFGIGLTSFSACLAIIASATGGIIYLSVRQLHFMNGRIANHLQPNKLA
jgi:hypothetical protein